jgi:leucyl aminopeptidase
LVDNLISWDAFKPWDVITMYNKKTVEINNTDAEWRLILADTMSYVEQKYKPSTMLDFATLTWAQIVATGTKIWAIMWTDKELMKKIQREILKSQ